MFVTALVGFLASVGMLKLGLEQMWLRYPLAVLFAWVVFLVLVRLWAEVTRAAMRMDEELARPDSQADDERESVWRGAPPEADMDQWRWWRDVLDFLSRFLDFEGCLVIGAVIAFVATATGAAIALGSMILQAEALLAEVLLDAVLVTALYQRLRKKELEWWTSGVLRHTIKPVLLIMSCLILAGIFAHIYAPEALSIGGVWRHFLRTSLW